MQVCPVEPEVYRSTSAQRGEPYARALIVALVLAVPVLVCFHQAFVGDADVWWHLRTGEWILQHRAVPRTDPFSSFGAGKPWQAYSWLFEILTLKLFQRWNLDGILALTATLLVAITAALYHLVRRLQPDFAQVVLLTSVVMFSISRCYTPRPWLFSILFFVVEIDILMQARRTGRTRELFWLPLVYVLWANIHVQFVDGLAVLALAGLEPLLGRVLGRQPTRLPFAAAWCTLGACVLATCLNPYGWHIYQVAYDLASQPGVLNRVSEMEALPFRNLQDYVILLLALAGAAALAWKRRFPVFETAFLVTAVLLSFRSQRDVWITAVGAAAVIASNMPAGERESPPRLRPLPLLTALGALVLMVWTGSHVFHLRNAELAEHVADTMPVRAVEFVQQKNYPGRLYNDYPWGGYLIWALRRPVSMDGRAALHGDKRLERSAKTWSGQPDWAADPDLQGSGLVIGPVNAPLTQILRLAPGYKLVYEDKLAAVFIRTNATPGS